MGSLGPLSAVMIVPLGFACIGFVAPRPRGTRGPRAVACAPRVPPCDKRRARHESHMKLYIERR
jgi:hypothetical protein